MDKRMLFIFNPHAGKGKIRNKLADILDVFTKEGFLVTAYPTQGPGDVEKILKSFAGQTDRIVCSGGDGTLDETVSALMRLELDLPIGYLPSGSTNDFATSLHIPRDLKKAALVAATGTPHLVDIGSFNGDTFVYIAAFGAFTDVAYKTNQEMKNTLGYLAYMIEAGKQIFKIPSHHLQADIGGEKIEGDYAYGMVTNARSVGGMRNITGNRIDLQDGLFEVTLVHRPRNPLELSEVFATLLSEKGTSPLVETYKAGEVRLELDEAVPWTLDGEYGGEHSSVEIRNLHRHMQIYLDVEPRIETRI